MSTLIDLDAARRELTPIPLRFKGEEYVLPAELPAAVLDPLVSGRLNSLTSVLVGIFTDSAAGGRQTDAMDAIVGVLTAAPSLPADVAKAILDSIAAVFGPEQWQRWLAASPSLGDYARLIKGLWGQYGVGLGEAWASLGSSTTGGATSSATSPPAASTPAASGSPLGIPN